MRTWYKLLRNSSKTKFVKLEAQVSLVQPGKRMNEKFFFFFYEAIFFFFFFKETAKSTFIRILSRKSNHINLRDTMQLISKTLRRKATTLMK